MCTSSLLSVFCILFRDLLHLSAVVVADPHPADIVRGVVNTGARVAGPIPLPSRRSVITVLRSPHVNKKSREQFEIRVHSRLIEIMDPNE